MRGTIRKRTGANGVSWQALVKVTDPATGKPRQIVATRSTKEAAESALLELLTKAGHAGAVGSSATVGELLDAWQKLNAAHWSPSTVRNTRDRVEAYLRPRIGARKVSKLRTSELDLLYVELRAAGGKAGKDGKRKPLSKGSVAKVHSDLRAALTQAVRWEWIATNPAERATLPREGETRVVRPPKPSEVIALIERAETTDADFAAFLHLDAAAGARRGELCALRWTDLELGDSPTVTIARALAIGDAGVVEKTTKTNGHRTISLDPETADVVRAHRRRAAERALACGRSLPADAFVFTLQADGSKPWSPTLATHRFGRLRKALGLDHVRLHDLRHFMVTELLAAGVDLATVAGRAGHRGGGRTTLAVYAHLTEHADEGAAAVIGSLLKRRGA